MCVCVCVCVAYAFVWTIQPQFFLLAASIRLACRLIAEGIAKLARPIHSRQSAMSSMSVTHGHHLALSASLYLSFFPFLSFSHARMNILPCQHPLQTSKLPSTQSLEEGSCFCSATLPHTNSIFESALFYLLYILSWLNSPRWHFLFTACLVAAAITEMWQHISLEVSTEILDPGRKHDPFLF